MNDMNFTPGEKVSSLMIGAVLAYFIIYFSAWAPVFYPSFSFKLEGLYAFTGVVIGSLFFGIFCIPIAIIFCILFGYPIWALVESIAGNSVFFAILASLIAGILPLAFATILSVIPFHEYFNPDNWLSVTLYFSLCICIGLFTYFCANGFRRSRLETSS